MLFGSKSNQYSQILKNNKPAAQASVHGDSTHPDIRGIVSFFPVLQGTIVEADIFGLPSSSGKCAGEVFGFHIHEGTSCTGPADDPFKDSMGHYNPNECDHPHHAGDLPPLFGNHGYAWSAFFTDRFRINEVVGRTVIIHASPDDFHSQPAGNSGAKIACGVIQKI